MDVDFCENVAQLTKRVAKANLEGANTPPDAESSETLRRLREQNEDADTDPVEPKPVSSEFAETPADLPKATDFTPVTKHRRR